MKPNLTGKRLIALFLTLAGLLFLATPAIRAQAQENIANVTPQDNGEMVPSADDSQNPPSRVARLSYMDGSVSMQPGGAGDWGSAAKNRPVTIGDKLWTDKDSRVELQAGQASIHLGSMTALSFLNLDQNVIQMRLAEGHVNFRVRELRQGETYEIDAPNLAFTVREAGAFRVDVNENGDYTTVSVIRGKGEVAAGGQTYAVNAGERADISGNDQNVKYIPGSASEPDGLDRWAQERNIKEDQSASAHYVSRDTVGYSDLDDYGTWKEEPEVGNVWVPNNVSPGWAPYSDGNWAYVAPWGWTWVGYEPWGFAPYHYGRWNYFGSYWGWCPGPIYASPYYGPAFVGFVGGGFGFGFGGGFGGGIGWFPLGFGEPFNPWFHCSRTFINNVNISNTRINNVNILNNANANHFNFRYAHDARAVTAASRNTFVNGQAINRGSAHLTQASLRGAQVTNGASFSPTKASFTGAANARGRVSTPPSSVMNRSVMARTAPAAAASHIPVRTMNTQHLSAGRTSNTPASTGANRPGAFGGRNSAGNAPSANNRPGRETNNNAAMTPRQRELSNNRPPSASAGINGRASVNGNGGASANRPPNGTRNWAAQGNATDRGRAPQGSGSGSSNRPSNGANQMARATHSDRPPWAGSGSRSNPSSTALGSTSRSFNNDRPSGSNRSYQPPSRSSSPNYNNNRPSYSNGGSRSYEPPSRSYTAPGGSYSAPSRSYSAPSRSYSPPSRSYSAPSQSY